MQTFLPYPSFAESAAVLDRQRLGKQRVEAWQILRALTGQSRGWTRHPATRMWQGFEGALAVYGIAMCDEWISRGYKDTLRVRFFDAMYAHGAVYDHGRGGFPSWLGDVAFHASHRANLLRKSPAFYGAYGWTEDPELPYVWPVSDDT